MRTLFLLGLALACGPAEETGTETDTTVTDTDTTAVRIEEVRLSGCLDSGGEVEFGASVEGTTVHVSHHAMLACCIEGVDVAAAVSGSTVTLTYTELGEPCDCACPYGVTYDILGLGSGTWTLEATDVSYPVTIP